MIFTRQEAQRIARGRKIQHRFDSSRRPPELLRTIPVSFRDPTPVEVCRVIVLSVDQQEVEEATEADAEREGWKDLNELCACWPMPPEPMWVIRFRLDRTHKPRFLSSRVIAGRQGDYVDSPARAMAGEPEAVDEASLSLITAEARERDRERRAARRDERHDMDFEDQVRHYEALARMHHIDIRSELRAIRRWANPMARRRQLQMIRQKIDVAA